jgi:uncharacterized circularly permuted ATP-grasp superfamily protein
VTCSLVLLEDKERVFYDNLDHHLADSNQQLEKLDQQMETRQQEQHEARSGWIHSPFSTIATGFTAYKARKHVQYPIFAHILAPCRANSHPRPSPYDRLPCILLLYVLWLV